MLIDEVETQDGMSLVNWSSTGTGLLRICQFTATAHKPRRGGAGWNLLLIVPSPCLGRYCYHLCFCRLRTLLLHAWLQHARSWSSNVRIVSAFLRVESLSR